MNIEYIIRKAEPKDIPALTGLLKQLFAIESDFTFDELKQSRGLRLMLESPNQRCIMVAQSGAQIIGMCSAQLLVSTAEGGTAALIEDMVITGEYQRRGIGKTLLTAIEDWAIRQGATRLELLTDRNNRTALEFYQKMNWDTTQLICLHKRTPG